ncbi:MAG: hypothetical protein AB3N34_00495 [Lettuce witches'-broom phytoplasma]
MAEFQEQDRSRIAEYTKIINELANKRNKFNKESEKELTKILQIEQL